MSSAISTKSKADIINERQAHLPLPDQPPTASDWQSADQRKVNIGARAVESDVSTGGASDAGLREPTGDSAVRADGDETGTNMAPMAGIGRPGRDGLDDIPSDALTRDAM
jgi:hypothetical protein